MRDSIQKIKNWYSDWRFRHNQDREANYHNSELNKRYYKSNSNDIIKILTELEEKAGLSSYDIVPFLKNIRLMPYKGSFIEKGSGGSVTDRHRNDELFKELEKLEFIRIISNNLLTNASGIKYNTPTDKCVLKIKLLPKGIDYLTDNRKRTKDKFYQKLTIGLLIVASILSLPQACNQTLEWFKKYDTIYKINIVNKESETEKDKQPNTTDDLKDNIRSGKTKEVPVVKPISNSSEH